MIPWHRLFGLALHDYFAGTAWEVLLEMDLSLRQQRLDIVIVRRGDGPEPPVLPDGLGDLADHNLITYKSLNEALDGWAVKELIGHSVNYRKQQSPSLNQLLPESAFKLYAVSTRYPEKLANHVGFEPVGEGVYDIPWGTDRIRLLVLSEIPAAEENAVLNLFSGMPDAVRFGAEHYDLQAAEMSSILNDVLARYQLEGIPMPYTIEDYRRDVTRETLARSTPEERAALLAGLPPEQRLAGLLPEQRLAGLPPEQRLAGLLPEQRLAGLSPEEIESYLRKLRSERDAGDKKNGSNAHRNGGSQ